LFTAPFSFITGGITNGVTYFGTKTGSSDPPGTGAADAPETIQKTRINVAKTAVGRENLVGDISEYLLIGLTRVVKPDTGRYRIASHRRSRTDFLTSLYETQIRMHSGCTIRGA
jgi:hypothetical protein